MKTHTKEFKDAINMNGKQLDSIISYKIDDVNYVLGMDDLNSITPHFEGAILKSVMKQLDIDSSKDIPIGTEINYKFGVLVNNEYEYLDYGNYIVYSSEYNADTLSYEIICYDKMLNAMLDYKPLDITYPTTVRNYITKLAEKIGLQFKNSDEEFTNYEKYINSDVYNNIGYTYRDVLDELAQVTASTICLDLNDKLEIRYIENGKIFDIKDNKFIIDNDSNIEIRSVKAETMPINLKITGKNIFNYYDSLRNTNVGVSRTINNSNSVTIKGSAAWSNTSLILPNVLKNQDMVISAALIDTAISHKISFNIYGNNEPTTSNLITITSSPAIDINKNEEKNIGLAFNTGNYDYLVIRFYNNATNKVLDTTSFFEINNIQLELIDMTPFEPYKKQEIEITTKDNKISLYEEKNIITSDTNEEIEISFYTEENELINEDYLSDTNVKLEKKYGPINSIILTRAAGGDSIADMDEPSIQTNGLHEIKIEDNQIMNGTDSERRPFLDAIFERLNGLEYYIYNFNSPGIAYLELCDRFDTYIYGEKYPCVLFNDELNVTQGLQENLYTEEPEETETDYKYVSTEEQKNSQAYIVAKKAEAEVEAIAKKVVDLTKEKISNNFIIVDDAANVEIGKLKIIGNGGALYPSQTLYPSNNLYPLEVNLIIEDENKNKIKYKLPDIHLKYIDNLNYDELFIDGTNIYLNYFENGEKTTKNLGIIDIKLYEGYNKIYLENFSNAQYDLVYMIKNQYTDTFATKVELDAGINIATDNITSHVRQEYYSKDEASENNRVLESKISQSAHTIELTVNDSYGKNTGISITLKDANGNILSSGNGTIILSGDVIVKSNLTDGTTSISGDNITTGTINGEVVNVENINASNIKSGSISADYLNGGTISGSSINLNNKFTVDENGNATASSFSLTGGSVNMSNVGTTTGNSKYKVGKWAFTNDGMYLTTSGGSLFGLYTNGWYFPEFNYESPNFAFVGKKCVKMVIKSSGSGYEREVWAHYINGILIGMYNNKQDGYTELDVIR